MKERFYHLTSSGIRIPKHKIKWMAPRKGKATNTSYSAESMLPSLYFHDPRPLLAAMSTTISAGGIEDTDQHGGDRYDN